MSVAINQVRTRPVTAQGWKVLAVLSALIGCASISTDFYLPAMPTMGGVLGAGAGAVEWTISGYLIGFSFGQLLWGPIGDRFGRRVPVAIGLALFIAGSAGCALSGTIWAVIGWRVVQAIGAAAGVVLGRAMVRDLYEGHRAAQMMSTLITIMAIAPLLGPIIGGQVLVLSGWRAIFWTLVVIGLAMFAALWTLPETLPPDRNGRYRELPLCPSDRHSRHARDQAGGASSRAKSLRVAMPLAHPAQSRIANP
jgi:DHA1 family bicyclomycin/chloramphenicol resistance-like MFS transporter